MRPSRSAARVASGSRKYAVMRAGERTAISPTAPGGSGRPASSTIATSTPGTGRPHEPGRGGAPSGVSVTTPASVEPKHSTTSSTPKRACTRSRTGAAPSPRITRRRCVRSRSDGGRASSIARIVPIVKSTVAPLACTSGQNALAWNARGKATVAPAWSAVWTAPQALPWKSGVTARIVSSGCTPSAATKWRPVPPEFPWGKSTPLGVPVVPEV